MNEFDPVQSWLSRLAPTSRASARSSLAKSARILFPDGNCRWESLGAVEISGLIQSLAEDNKKATVAKDVSFVKEVLRECWRLGLKTRDDMERAVSIRWLRPSSPPVGRHLSREDRQRLLSACGDGDRGLRDRAIVRLMLLGLRRAEVAMVQVQDVSFSEGTVRVEGKGKRRREVPMGDRTAVDLKAYIASRGQGDGRLILPHRDGAFSKCGGGISVRALNKIVARLSSLSGVKLTPHDMRRSAIGDWLGTVDVGIAMRMAGHSNPQTTVRYDHRNVNLLGRAAAAASEI